MTTFAAVALAAVAPSDAAERLATNTMAALRKTFAEYQHRPSAAQWKALEAIAKTLANMARGICPAKPHLSALDPGVGKTQVVVHFLRVLMASPYRDVGVLICIKRKEQLRDIVDQAGLSPGDYAFLTADEELNGRGVGIHDRTKARVLFTTHRQIELRVGLRPSFANVEAFHYRGNARAVRVWDEALLPSLPLTIPRSCLGRLFAPLERSHPALVADLEDLYRELSDIPDGHQFSLPDLAAKHGEVGPVLLALRDAGETKAIPTTEALWMLSGRVVTVRRDVGVELAGGDRGADGGDNKKPPLRRASTMLDYRDHLPDDLWPILILDASGRVRTLYKYWETRRTGLVRLEPAGAKSYAGHTVHIMKVSGSKTAWKKAEKARKLAAEIAATILTRPTQLWLIVHHKAKSVNGFDLETEVRKLLPAEAQSMVSFTTWGRHDASNEWKTVPNVILAGLLYLPKSVLEARGRCASNYPSAAGVFAPNDLDEVAIGEHRHEALQAMCRGRVRACIDGKCPPNTHTYIMASPKDGISSRTINLLMPDASVEDWTPSAKVALKGRVKEAVSVITRHDRITAMDVMTTMNWPTDKYGRLDFKDRIRDNPSFQRGLAEEGYEEVRQGRGGKVWFVRVAE